VAFHKEIHLLCSSYKEICGRHRDIKLSVTTIGSVGKTIFAGIIGLQNERAASRRNFNPTEICNLQCGWSRGFGTMCNGECVLFKTMLYCTAIYLKEEITEELVASTDVY
jgi:hypothetical protein